MYVLDIQTNRQKEEEVRRVILMAVHAVALVEIAP